MIFKNNLKKNKNSLFNLLFRLFSMLGKKIKIRITTLIFLMLISYGAETLSLLSIVAFLKIISNSNMLYENNIIKSLSNYFGIYDLNNLILGTSLLFSFTILISAFLKLLTNYMSLMIAANIGSDLSNKAYFNIIHQSYEEHIESNSSEVINGIITQTQRTVWAVEYFIQFLSSLGLVSILLLVLIKLEGSYAITLGLILSFIYLLIGYIFKRKLNTYSNIFTDLSKKHLKIMQEAIGSIRDLLIGNHQEIFMKLYKRNDIKMRRIDAKNNFLSLSPKYLIEALAFISIITFGLLFNLSNNNLIIIRLGTIAYGAQKLLPALQTTFLSWAKMNSFISSLKDVLDLVDRKIDKAYFIGPKNSEPFNNKIELKNICYKYKDSKGLNLKNLNLTIKKGERVAFIGKTGSGKSTLLDIIMGLLKPYKGQLIIDGVDITSNKKMMKNWRQSIGHVPQNIYLSDNSIAENIAFGFRREDIDWEKIYEASKKANIDEFISNSKSKYETVIGERGIRLSGGQRQRIGIARAIYSGFNCLILDEATSSLDSHTEKEIMNSINSLGRDITIIMVTHRMNTIQNFDKVYYIDNGEISR